MQLGGQRSSGNVEDRRGIGVGGGLGIGTIVVALVAMFLGVDPSTVINMAEQAQQMAPQQQAAPRDPNKPKDEGQVFVEKVLGSTEDVWKQVFSANGKTYAEPSLVLFSGAVRSACGMAQAAMGPFYCPRDQKVYIDLAFYKDLRDRFRAPGDFAQAYVIAHEVGHHVQNQLGTMQKLEAMQGRVSKQEFNQMSVRVELQADCFAGVWAKNSARLLDPGDLEEGLAAASAIGDDRLQKQSQGVVVPESFTHGSSAQRVRWFRRGMDSGRVTECDTFRSGAL